MIRCLKKLGNLLAKNKGWILADALIGAVIIAIALTALMAAFTQGSRSMVHSRSRFQALSIAQQQMEDLKKYNGNTGLPATWAATTTTVSNVQYTIQLQRLNIASLSTVPKLVPVQVTLTWQDPGASGTVSQTLQIVEYILTQ